MSSSGSEAGVGRRIVVEGEFTAVLLLLLRLDLDTGASSSGPRFFAAMTVALFDSYPSS